MQADDSKSDLGEVTPEEKKMLQQLATIWEAIIGVVVEDSTDFFASGAGSMDVTRMVEEVREKFEVDLETAGKSKEQRTSSKILN